MIKLPLKLLALFISTLLLIHPLITSSYALECKLEDGETHKVIEVIDGDTVKLENGKEIRMVGIQAPKLPLGRKNFKKWPLSDEAKVELESLLLNRNITLHYPTTKEDRHRRILAHIFVKDVDSGNLIWAQNYMIKKGLARVYSFLDNRLCVEDLLKSEIAARAQKLGIWNNDYYKILNASDENSLIKFKNTFQIIEGKIHNVTKYKSTTYINFKEEWREDFTLEIANKQLRLFKKYNLDISSLVGKNIRSRGWITLKNGPKIDITHPEQIEVLK